MFLPPIWIICRGKISQCVIHLYWRTLIYHPPWCKPPRYNELVEVEIQKMLEARIIITPSPAWYVPVVIATKKSEKPSFCAEYRALNQVTRADCWSFPNIEKIFNKQERSKVFKTLYMFSGYWKISIEEIWKEMTMFVKRSRTYQFGIMSLCRLGSLTRRQPFNGYRKCFASCNVFESPLRWCRGVLNMKRRTYSTFGKTFLLVEKHNLKIKLSKREFAKSSVKLVGHIVGTKEISIDRENVATIRDAVISQIATSFKKKYS